MKKFIALLLALTIVLSFAACGTTDNKETTPETTTEATEATKAEGVMTYAEYAAAALDSEVVVESCIQAIESWWDGKIQLYLRQRGVEHLPRTVHQEVCDRQHHQHQPLVCCVAACGIFNSDGFAVL